MVFDGSSTSISSATSIALIKEDGETIAKSFKLDSLCSSSVSKYEAYLIGLAVTHEARIKHLKVVEDSNFIIYQAKGEFSLKKPSLAPYRALTQHSLLKSLMTLRIENRYVDALTTISSQVSFEGPKADVTINKKSVPITEVLKKVFEEQHLDYEDWRIPSKIKLMSPKVVPDLKELEDYVLITRDLYHRLPRGILAI